MRYNLVQILNKFVQFFIIFTNLLEYNVHAVVKLGKKKDGAAECCQVLVLNDISYRLKSSRAMICYVITVKTSVNTVKLHGFERPNDVTSNIGSDSILFYGRTVNFFGDVFNG